MSVISAIIFDQARFAAGDRRIFCDLGDKVLACDGEKALAFATALDEDEVVAFQRYLDNKPDEFFLVDVAAAAAARELSASQASVEGDLAGVDDGASYTATLTPMDRARMRNIVRKHAAFYFKDEPTLAQIDQLIESIGPIAAQACVRKATAKGTI